MSKRMSRYPSDRKVYVGDLGNNAKKNELEYAFSAYGTLRSVWIARNPPGFAFVEFEDSRDAADAVRGLDGRSICGRRARVELSTGKLAGTGRNNDRRGGSRGRGRPFHPDDQCYECGGRGHYARDCRRYGRGRRRSRSRSRSRSYSRDHRTRSRTGSRSDRSRSRSRSRSRTKDSREDRPKATARSDRRSRENGHGNGDAHHSGDDSPPPTKRKYTSSRSARRSASKTSRRSRTASRHRDSRSRSRSGRNAD